MRAHSRGRIVRAFGPAILIGVLIIGSCSSTKKAAAPKGKPLQEYEKNFDPSKYRKPPAEKKPDPISPVTTKSAIPETMRIERIEKVMGYKIQLYSTTDLDDAMKMKETYAQKIDSLSNGPTEIDVEYDAPYYKVRVGNYLQKKSADAMKEDLKSHGMPEAWIVRTNVNRTIRENIQQAK
jgi:hypothetical protein